MEYDCKLWHPKFLFKWMEILNLEACCIFCFPFKYFQSIRVTIKILFTTILGKRTENLRKIRLGKWGMKYISMQGNISVNTFFFFFFNHWLKASSRTKFKHPICKPDFPKYWASNSSHKFLQEVAEFLVLLSIKTHMSVSKNIFGNLASDISFEKLYSPAEYIMGDIVLVLFIVKEWIIK